MVGVARAGRLTMYRNLELEVPAHVVVPTCAKCGAEWIDEAAAELGVSRRQMYVLLQRFRAGSGRATDLMPASTTGLDRCDFRCFRR